MLLIVTRTICVCIVFTYYEKRVQRALKDLVSVRAQERMWTDQTVCKKCAKTLQKMCGSEDILLDSKGV